MLFHLILANGCNAPTTPYGEQDNPPPNIIFILADDLGWMDSELYGSKYYETPNLVRLANEGMYFTNAYSASPLCSPTRASIMSGQYPSRIKITSAITPKDVSEPGALRPNQDEYCGDVQNKNHMPLEVRTLAEVMKAEGYNTAHIGKWHLSPSYPGWIEGDSTYNAEHQGFDYVIGGDHLPGPPDYYSPYKNRIANLTPGSEGEYLNERLSKEAIRWIESVKNSDSPFYLNFWQYAVHGPWIAKKELLPKYQSKVDPRSLQDCPENATMIESLDNSIGILLDWLELPENETLKNNTIIVFASDNGGIVHEVPVSGVRRPVTSNRPLRGGKANIYEGGIRVPWIIRWPAKIQKGTVNHVPISTLDVFPTFRELARVQPSENLILDGRSIVPLLDGRELEEAPIFWDFPHRFGALCAPSTAVRKGDYKLIRFYWAGEEKGSHHYELFNLKKDTAEAINLALHLPEKVQELDQLITKHLKDTDALIPELNTEFTGNPQAPRSNPEKAKIRPVSYHLSKDRFVPETEEGTYRFQLYDQNNKPCPSAALALTGGEWISLKNNPDGSMEISWDRKLKKEDAIVLFGWNGGVTSDEMNDWTMDPAELIIQ